MEVIGDYQHQALVFLVATFGIYVLARKLAHRFGVDGRWAVIWAFLFGGAMAALDPVLKVMFLSGCVGLLWVLAWRIGCKTISE